MASGGLEPTIYELRGDGGMQVRYATIDPQGRHICSTPVRTASTPIPARRSTPATPSWAAR